LQTQAIAINHEDALAEADADTAVAMIAMAKRFFMIKPPDSREGPDPNPSSPPSRPHINAEVAKEFRPNHQLFESRQTRR
jgi:hypothetical protein